MPSERHRKEEGHRSLASALGQPPLSHTPRPPRPRAPRAPWLRFIDPGSGSSLTPRHSGDAASGSRLPWEPRGGPGARRTTLGARGAGPAPRARSVAFDVSEGHLSPGAKGGGVARFGMFPFSINRGVTYKP